MRVVIGRDPVPLVSSADSGSLPGWCATVRGVRGRVSTRAGYGWAAASSRVVRARRGAASIVSRSVVAWPFDPWLVVAWPFVAWPFDPWLVVAWPFVAGAYVARSVGPGAFVARRFVPGAAFVCAWVA
jgi:hypothetical protein